MYHTYSKGGGGRGTYCSYLLYYYKIFFGGGSSNCPFWLRLYNWNCRAISCPNPSQINKILIGNYVDLRWQRECGFGLAYHEHVQLDCQWLISNQYWWCRNVHQWGTRSLRSNNRCLKIRKYKETPSRGGPVWSRPNTLWRLSQKTFLQL